MVGVVWAEEGVTDLVHIIGCCCFKAFGYQLFTLVTRLPFQSPLGSMFVSYIQSTVVNIIIVSVFIELCKREVFVVAFKEQFDKQPGPGR